MYEKLEKFLNSDKYTEDLRNELQQSNPDYPTVLEKRRLDMGKTDHGIVVSGIAYNWLLLHELDYRERKLYICVTIHVCINIYCDLKSFILITPPSTEQIMISALIQLKIWNKIDFRSLLCLWFSTLSQMTKSKFVHDIYICPFVIIQQRGVNVRGISA